MSQRLHPKTSRRLGMKRLRELAMKRQRRLLFEQLEDRRVLAGLQVIDLTPQEVRNAIFDHVDVSFSHEINAETFSQEDVSITGPTGAVTVSGITSVDADTFRINFTALSERGSYEVVIGPEILDLDGDSLD